MTQTVQFWRASDNAYHPNPPGIAVLTDDTEWEALTDQGWHVPSDYPAEFEGQVHSALSYLNTTPAGANLLSSIEVANRIIDITPSSTGNTVRSVRSEDALNRVAAEIIANDGPRGIALTALSSMGDSTHARAQWLCHFINNSPHWSLDGLPGNNGSYFSFLERARKYANQWALLIDPRYLHWGDSNEGYFNRQRTFGNHVGVGPNDLGITRQEVAAWLQGNPLPGRLTSTQKESAIIATIVALKDVSPASIGTNAHVGWNPTRTNPLNEFRPPAIGLGHELIHAYFSGQGSQLGYDDSHYSTVLFEYRCVGLGPWDEAPLSENALRNEWWSNACPHIPASDKQNRKAVGKRICYN